jgi:anthranilate synthase component 1
VDVATIPIGGDPDFSSLHARYPERYPFLLQSTAQSGGLGRFEILFACPGETIEAEDGSAFLEALDTAFQRDYREVDLPLPFIGGWFLYLGYELAGEIERSLNLDQDAQLPRAFAVRCRAALIRDLELGTVVLVAETDGGIEPLDVAGALSDDILGLAAPDSRAFGNRLLDLDEEPPDDFLEAVEAARRYIAAGDVYQVNLSREWRVTAEDPINATALFRSLAAANPAPFAGIMHWQGKEVVSSSPERLLSVRDGHASTRPIAGTRPRSDNLRTDRALLDELIAHPKERAEHVMLIDLERNDLGRVCLPGTVEVTEMMVLESYAHVHHIVSNVCGRLRKDVLPGDIIRAVFPGGTITGCPKVRCMEIISELEAGPRGAYTGSFGYLNRDGSMDTNILIRSIVVDGESASFRAGSGIVADSVPEAELEETRAKAKGLRQALKW